MTEIINNLFVGTDLDCASAPSDTAIIHACKTCHAAVLSYKGSLPQTHPNYLIYEKANHLYLNMVDMERELLPQYTHPIMKEAMHFIEKHITDHSVLIHCNQGYSRSPAIGLVYLSRHGIIPKSSYREAVTSFLDIYGGYAPGNGVDLYLQNNWIELMAI